MTRVGILASGDGRDVRALQEALVRQGALPVRLQARRLAGAVEDRPSVRATGSALESLDALLVRFIPPGSLDQIVFRMDCLHLLADAGLPVVNAPRAIERTVDKHWTSRLLSDAGIPTPRTVAAEGFDEAMEAFASMRDVLVKPLLGSGGRGIIRLSDEDLAYRTFRALEMQRAVFYLQEFVPHGTFDLRLFVVSDRLVAAARRTGRGWKTNVAAGAVARAHRPAPRQEELALRACRAVGADYAGVDILEAEDGRTLVLEVNGVPGWSALQATTSVDIASEIAGLALRRAAEARGVVTRA